PQLHRIEENAAVGGSSDENGDRQPGTCGQQPFTYAVFALLLPIISPQPVTHFGSCHLLLKFGLTQARAQKTILIQQNILVESNIGDADDLFVPELGVVAMDRDFVKRIVPMSIEAPVAVVITNGVCGTEICDPARLEQRNQPGQML